MSNRHPLAWRLDDGRILLRHSTQERDATKVDGSVTIGPDHQAYANWNAEITQWAHSTSTTDDPDDYQSIDYENLPMFPVHTDEER